MRIYFEPEKGSLDIRFLSPQDLQIKDHNSSPPKVVFPKLGDYIL